MAIEVNNNDLKVNGLTAINIAGLEASTVLASGTNTNRSLQNRFADVVNVKDYGAIGNGVVDDTAAFVSAVTASPASVNIFKGDNSIPYPDVIKIYVPPGTYNITSLVTTGGRKVIWELSQSAKVTNYSNLNGKVLRAGERISNSTPFGIRDNAVGMSVMSRTEDLEKGAEVTGIINIRDLGWYSDRDSVSFYTENVSNSLVADISNATYTLSAINPTTPLTTDQIKKLIKGMIVETKSTPKWTGILNSWATNGASLSTTGWVKYTGVKATTNKGTWTTSTAYVIGDYFISGGLEYIVIADHTSSSIAADLAANKIDFITGTPSSGGARINPFTKIWGHNANITLTNTGYASAATGFELGVLNNLATPANATALPKMWGMDVVNLGTYKASVAYTSRGEFFRAYEATGADVTLFSINAQDRDIVCIDNNAYETFVLDGNAGRIELGNTNIGGTRVIDFRNSGTPGNDYDCRIRAVSGTSTSTGQGYMSLLAARVGIGTQDPNQRLTVSGNISATGTVITDNDIEITDKTKGIILSSPDGTRYRITVQNGGTLNIAAV